MKRRESMAPEIDMAPMIDVVFLLLIFFMVTTTFQTRAAVPVRLPGAPTADAKITRDIEIVLTGDQKIFVNREETALQNLSGLLQKMASENKERTVFLYADKDLSYGDIVRVLDLCRGTGFVRVSLVADNSRSPGK